MNCKNCKELRYNCVSCRVSLCKEHLIPHLNLKAKHLIKLSKESKIKDLKEKFIKSYQALNKLKLEIHQQIRNFLKEIRERSIQFSVLLSMVERKYFNLYSTFTETFSPLDLNLKPFPKPSKFDLNLLMQEKFENAPKQIPLKNSLHNFYLNNMSGLRCLKVSDKEKFLITGGFDHSIRIWNLDTKKQETLLLGHNGTVNSVSISLDSSLLLSGSDDRTVRLWDFHSRTETFCFKGHTSAVMSVDISAKNNYAFSGSIDMSILCWHLSLKTQFYAFNSNSKIFCVKSIKENILFGSQDGRLKMLKLESGLVVEDENFHQQTLFTIEVSRNLKVALTGGLDGTICCWDLEHFSVSKRLNNKGGQIYSLALDPFATICVSGSSDKLIMVWDLKACILIHSIKIQIGSIFGVYLSENRDKVYSASQDGTLNIFVLEKKKIERSFALDLFLISTLAISSNHKFLACAYDVLKLYDLIESKELEIAYEENESMPLVNTFSSDSSLLLTGYINGSLVLRDVYKLTILKSWKEKSMVKLICISHNIEKCAYYSEDKIIKFVNLKTKKSEGIIKRIDITAMAFHSDNSSLIVCNPNGIIRKINKNGTQIIFNIEQEIKSICYSEDYLFLFVMTKFNQYFCIDLEMKTNMFQNEDQYLLEMLVAKHEALQFKLNYS